MKRFPVFIACLLFTVSLSAAEKYPDARVLVLGFDLPGSDSVQRRYLREELMRELSAIGKTVVPVMELEEHFLGDNSAGDNLSPAENNLHAWAERIPSCAIVSGRCDKTSSGTWNVHCIVYLVKEKKYMRKTVSAEGSTLPDTKKIAGEILIVLNDTICPQP